MEDFYRKKHILLEKIIKEVINKWRNIFSSWPGRLDMVKVSNIPKLSHRLTTMPIKIPTAFLEELNKLILRFIWKNKGPRIAKTFLKKHEVGRFAQKM